MNRFKLTWTVLAGITALSTAYLVTADDKPAQPPAKPVTPTEPFKPVQKVETMMEGQELLFDGLRDNIKNEKWDDGYLQSWILAEMANVNVHHATDAEYARLAREMSKACIEMSKTMKSRSTPDAQKAYVAVQNCCKACHDGYKK